MECIRLVSYELVIFRKTHSLPLVYIYLNTPLYRQVEEPTVKGACIHDNNILGNYTITQTTMPLRK
jgi:hypothetical protein